MTSHYFWLALFLLGCYHGINPAMGWLFATALGFQERRTGAVLRAAVPLTLGHLLSVAAIVLVASFAAVEFPHAIVQRVAAGILLGFGGYRLVRARHPRWVGMRVGFMGLLAWGFLMSSAHGAGLMLVPFVTTKHAVMPGAMAMPAPIPAANAPYALGLLVIAVHTLGYLAAMITAALLVYSWIGVSFLRKGWLNVDLIWSATLLATGIVLLLT